MPTSLFSLLVSRPSGLGYEAAWQKEADDLRLAAEAEAWVIENNSEER